MKHLFSLIQCTCGKSDFLQRGEVVECRSCKKIFSVRKGKIFFVDPPDVWPESSHKNPTDRASWSKLRKGEFKFTARSLGGIRDSVTVYDLGAGESHFKDLLGRFKQVVRVDLFPYEGIDIVADFTAKVPLRDESGGVVVLSNVLEHIKEPEFFLKECHRVLSSGGVIVGTIPFLLEVHQAPYDYNRFTPYMLTHLLSKAGFTDIEIESVSTPFKTYEAMTAQFLKAVGSLDVSKSEGFQLKALWKMAGFLNNRFRKIYSRVPPSGVYTSGYGFKARKK